ncbi:MAG: DEAD/DEAH box helicase family protein [Leptospiraceae bacterium]|nr:DEAD/DEAH box helicase family protein [Leptospiraceae bacterium]MCP5495749.1 DEAD/DEAH box helicase family protein [Leptospiraceae bacterium]
MSTKFFTNRDNNTLLAKFEGVFHNVGNLHCFDALVGYFRASGYFKIRPFLEKIPKIRILVGINVDSLVHKYHSKSMEYRGKPEDVLTEFFKSVQEDIQNAEYNKDIEHGVLQFIDDIIHEKIEIRAHPTKKIHAKIYIFRPENFNMYTHAEVISGSSNLTEPGLGTGNYFNYEFNVALRDYEDVKFATDEFELLWKESISILPVDAKNIQKNTHLEGHYSPFELYIKFLIEYFGENIDYNPDTVGDLPEKFKKLSYQIDAVNEGYQKIIQHNGFFLADVVGLGKTLVAAMIAKRFIFENGKGTRILIVYPPALEKTWLRHFKELKIDSYTQYISNGSLHKKIEKKVKSGSLKTEHALKQLIELSQKFSQSETNYSMDSEKEGLETEIEKPSVILAESFQ